MTLAQSENATPAKTVPTVNRDLTRGDFLTCQTFLVSSWQAIGSGRLLGSLHPLAPPGDLVTLLQHLLI
jgi:hypothetical protein